MLKTEIVELKEKTMQMKDQSSSSFSRENEEFALKLTQQEKV